MNGVVYLYSGLIIAVYLYIWSGSALDALKMETSGASHGR